MRLDKFFTQTKTLSRSQCAKAAKAGLITVDGIPVKDTSLNVDPAKNAVAYKGEVISYSEFVYILMNKPLGAVCSNDEPGEKTVFDLLDEKYRSAELFTVGRLDKNTTGLILITNDGKSAHNALSPKHHVEKEYVYELADPVSDAELSALEKGAELSDGYITRPCRIIPSFDKTGTIILSEGKYHQIRRMFASVGNKVVSLHRVRFGDITLDASLTPGMWRMMDDDEIDAFRRRAEN